MTQVRQLWFMPQNIMPGQQTISFVPWLCSKNPFCPRRLNCGDGYIKHSSCRRKFHIFFDLNSKLQPEQMSHKHTSKRVILDRKSELCPGSNSNWDKRNSGIWANIIVPFMSVTTQLSPWDWKSSTALSYFSDNRVVFVTISILQQCWVLYQIFLSTTIYNSICK